MSELFMKANTLHNSLQAMMNEHKKLKEDHRTFVSLVTHELLAPISSLTSLIELALEDTEEDRIEKLNMMQPVVKNMRAFTVEMGEYFRSLDTVVSIKEINWNHLFEQAISINRYHAGGDKIIFSLDYSGVNPVYSDSVRMKILINNVISNSIKYRKQNSDLIISASVRTDDHNTILEIRDNGIGVAPEKVDKIFDMFYRASDTGQGIGLGLFIVNEAIKVLEGTVEVTSELGQGTTLTFTFPVLNKNICLASDISGITNN